jgi:peptidoglycan-N-acetylglucosamine deacetylase
MSFDVTEGTATIALWNQTSGIVLANASYAVGHHDVIFVPLLAGTTLTIRSLMSGGAYKIDNFTFGKYDTGIQIPLMSSASPTTDTHSRNLIFKGQAKYNLQKVSSTVVNLPDYNGELFAACNHITVNDWYDANGVGNEIAWTNVARYQTGRQYYNHGILIIIKDGVSLTLAEDALLKQILGIGDAAQKYRSGIFLSFDDTDRSDSWIWADSTLSQYGWKASFAIMTPATNTTNQQDIDFITLWKPKLLTLVARGHELSNHTIRHESLAAYLVGHTRQQFYDDRIVPLKTIVTNSLPYTITSVLYPSWYGRDPVMSALLITNGYTTVRENTEYYPDDPKFVCYNGTSQIVLSFDIAPYTTTTFSDAQIIALLDYARDHDVIINIFSHSIVPTLTQTSVQVTLDRMKMICKYIKDNNMQFYRASDLSPSIFGL